MSTNELCSDSFIARLKAGDSQAFTDMVGLMGPRLISALKSQLNLCHEDAEEIVFDTMMKVRTKIADFKVDGPAKLTTWLNRITINAGIDFVRHQNTKFAARAGVISGDVLGESLQPLHDTQAHMDWKREVNDPGSRSPIRIVRELQAAHSALDRLSASDRDLLRLHTVHSYEEIAADEGEGVLAATVRVRHNRALNRFTEELKKELDYE